MSKKKSKDKFENFTFKQRLVHAFEPVVRYNVLYVLMIFLLIVYIFTKHPLIGLFTGLTLILAIVLETLIGASKKGIKNEAKETLFALFIAVFVFMSLSFILDTESPLNAIVSCSMLPYLDRGDFILARGLDSYKAPVFFVTSKEYDQIFSKTTTVFKEDKPVREVNGSMFAHCAYNIADPLCKEFFSNPYLFYEQRGPLYFDYGMCVKQNTKTKEIEELTCVKTIKKDDKIINATDLNNDIIIYSPKQTDYFALTGDIIHRISFIVKDEEENRVGYVTKGDNNRPLDISIYDPITNRKNGPINPEQIKGRVEFRIPYLGYIKLLVFGHVTETAGCDSYFI